MARKKKQSKKKNRSVEDVLKEMEGSANRRTLKLNIDTIKDEIERERIKKAELDAIPETHVSPEDLVLFKDLAPEIEKTKAEENAPKLTRKQKKLAKMEAELAAEVAKDEAKSRLAAGEDAKIGEDTDADSGIKKLKTSPYVQPDVPEGYDTGDGAETSSLSRVAQPQTKWQKFLGTGNRRLVMLGLTVGLPALIVIGTLLWFTRGWREWPGNLVLISIPLLALLTYVLDHYADDMFWTAYEDNKMLRAENRQDAAVIIPLILFFGVLSLNYNMDMYDAIFSFLRFIFLGAIVWAALIWLTRRIPTRSKKKG